MSYSPVLGRFIQRDPLGYVDGGSLYEYVRSGPVVLTDPSGTLYKGSKTVTDPKPPLVIVEVPCVPSDRYMNWPNLGPADEHFMQMPLTPDPYGTHIPPSPPLPGRDDGACNCDTGEKRVQAKQTATEELMNSGWGPEAKLPFTDHWQAAWYQRNRTADYNDMCDAAGIANRDHLTEVKQDCDKLKSLLKNLDKCIANCEVAKKPVPERYGDTSKAAWAFYEEKCSPLN